MSFFLFGYGIVFLYQHKVCNGPRNVYFLIEINNICAKYSLISNNKLPVFCQTFKTIKISILIIEKHKINKSKKTRHNKDRQNIFIISFQIFFEHALYFILYVPKLLTQRFVSRLEIWQFNANIEIKMTTFKHVSIIESQWTRNRGWVI